MDVANLTNRSPISAKMTPLAPRLWKKTCYAKVRMAYAQSAAEIKESRPAPLALQPFEQRDKGVVERVGLVIPKRT